MRGIVGGEIYDFYTLAVRNLSGENQDSRPDRHVRTFPAGLDLVRIWNDQDIPRKTRG